MRRFAICLLPLFGFVGLAHFAQPAAPDSPGGLRAERDALAAALNRRIARGGAAEARLAYLREARATRKDPELRRAIDAQIAEAEETIAMERRLAKIDAELKTRGGHRAQPGGAGGKRLVIVDDSPGFGLADDLVSTQTLANVRRARRAEEAAIEKSYAPRLREFDERAREMRDEREKKSREARAEAERAAGLLDEAARLEEEADDVQYVPDVYAYGQASELRARAATARRLAGEARARARNLEAAAERARIDTKKVMAEGDKVRREQANRIIELRRRSREEMERGGPPKEPIESLTISGGAGAPKDQ